MSIESNIRRVAQLLAFGADVSDECPLIVAAARIFLADQEGA